MTTVTFLRPDGGAAVYEVETGTSVMQAAVAHGEDGIVAECGGSLMCATCHVYVEEPYVGLLPEPAEDESELLECTASERRPNSRLSCQVRASGTLESLVVRLPEAQV